MPEIPLSPSSLAILATLLLAPLALFKFTTWAHHRRSQRPSEVVSLRVYPIKSCRGFEVKKTSLRMHGLELDRRWMFVDAKTREFLTIRQIPEMTLIRPTVSEDEKDLVIRVVAEIEDEVGKGEADLIDPVRIPLYPDATYLENHTTLEQVMIWNIQTDGYVYGSEVNAGFSRFLNRDVALVYKGPTPRVLRGNGDPARLGREQSTNFPDLYPAQIASLASINELNKRLVKVGDEPITIERFRPNIIIKGNAPWVEDTWKTVRISRPGGNDDVLDFDIVARCARCQVPNVNSDTASKHPRQPWDTLMGYRRIDEGIKFKPCFGMMSAPRREGVIEVGMKFEVVEETDQHRYIKGN